MEWFLVALIAILCTATTLACIVALIARNRINRHHRVDPAVATDAPITWLVDPRTPAKLHRRLARVGTTTTAVADDHRPPVRRFRKARRVETSPLVSTAQDVRSQAVLLDRQVARLSVLAPRARRGPLHELSRSVSEVEAAAARLVALSTQVRTPRGLSADDSALAAITSQVDRLAEAHQELLDLDRTNGLDGHTLPAPPLTGPTSAPRPQPQPEARPQPPQSQPEPQTWPPSPRR
ncbi:hypothetical protein BH10ACT1_BH10ACT1_37880 [soil metagenome]